MRHNENILQSPVHFAGTVAPFLIGWVIASLVVGLYSYRARESIRNAVIFTAGTWVIAVLIGAGLRATSFFHGDSPLTFVLVMLGFGLLFLVGWRAVATALTR
jgi:biotin transporter BioY